MSTTVKTIDTMAMTGPLSTMTPNPSAASQKALRMKQPGPRAHAFHPPRAETRHFFFDMHRLVKGHHVAYSLPRQKSLGNPVFSLVLARRTSRRQPDESSQWGTRKSMRRLVGLTPRRSPVSRITPKATSHNHSLSQRDAMIYSLVLLTAALTGPSAWQGDVVTEGAFGAELPGPYKHPAVLAELANGDLFLAYYGGSGEAGRFPGFCARLAKGSTKWTTPTPIRPRPKEPEGNRTAWQCDGVVWLLRRSTGRDLVDFAHLSPEPRMTGPTWSEPTYLTTEAGTMVRGKPILLAGGDYLLPVYCETGHDPEKVVDTKSFFLRHDPRTRNGPKAAGSVRDWAIFNRRWRHYPKRTSFAVPGAGDYADCAKMASSFARNRTMAG